MFWHRMLLGRTDILGIFLKSALWYAKTHYVLAYKSPLQHAEMLLNTHTHTHTQTHTHTHTQKKKTLQNAPERQAPGARVTNYLSLSTPSIHIYIYIYVCIVAMRHDACQRYNPWLRGVFPSSGHIRFRLVLFKSQRASPRSYKKDSVVPGPATV